MAVHSLVIAKLLSCDGLKVEKNTTSSSPSKLLILMDVSGRICEFYHVLPVFHSILLIPRPVSLVKATGWAKCAYMFGKGVTPRIGF